MVNSTSVLGFAMLKANFNDQQKSFQDNFTGFIIEAVRSKAPESVTAEEVSVHAKERFGLDIPSLVARNILSRAITLGSVRRGEDGGYTCTPKELRSGKSISADYDDFVRRQNQLSQKLLNFVKENFPDQAASLNREECGKLVARYMDLHALPLLNSGVKGSALTPPLAAEEDYLVAEFVAYAHEAEPDAFSFLVEVAKGATLAALLKMDVSSLQASLSKLWAYLDTSIMLSLLGYHGEAERSSSAEVLKISTSLGIKTSAFEHTVDEVRNILAAAQHTVRSGSRPAEGFKVAEHFIDSDHSPADIEILMSRLENDIALLGIEVREKPAAYHEFGLDEAELDSKLEKVLPSLSAAGRRYDVDSIAATHQLRGGKAGDKIERARALFITRNRQLVQAANRMRESKHEFPLLLLETTFASLLWVRQPSLASGLPEKRVLAAAWAGMQPLPHQWLQYLAEADKLVERGELSSEDALLLRVSQIGRHELMRSAVGDPSKFGQVKPADLLEKVKGDLSSPLLSKIHELEHERESSSVAIEAAETELSAMTSTLTLREDQLKQKEQEVRALNAQASAEKQSATEQRNRLYGRAHKSATRQVKLGLAVVCSLLVAIPVASQLLVVNTLAPPWPLPSTIVAIAGIAIPIIATLLPLMGLTVNRLRSGTISKMAAIRFTKTLATMGLATPTHDELKVQESRLG